MAQQKPVSVSFTQFCDFATKPPEQQLTVVRRVVKGHLDGYQPKMDQHKALREAIQLMLKEDLGFDYLTQVSSMQTEPSRAKHYPILVEGLRKWIGRKTFEGAVPQQGSWNSGGLEVRVRPEILAVLDGEPLLIKLWLAADPSLTSRRAKLINQLMYEAIPACGDELTPCVLDVRKNKDFRADGGCEEMGIILRSQATSFVQMYAAMRERLASANLTS